MTEITLTLPWPPSVNNYKTVGKLVRTKNGKLYQQRRNSDETRKFYFDVWVLIKPQMPAEGFKFRHDATISLGVSIDMHPPSESRYDLDNFLKVLLDSLMHAKVIADDSQIHRLFVQKKSKIPNGQVILTIYELPEGKESCT